MGKLCHLPMQVFFMIIGLAIDFINRIAGLYFEFEFLRIQTRSQPETSWRFIVQFLEPIRIIFYGIGSQPGTGKNFLLLTCFQFWSVERLLKVIFKNRYSPKILFNSQLCMLDRGIPDIAFGRRVIGRNVLHSLMKIPEACFQHIVVVV